MTYMQVPCVHRDITCKVSSVGVLVHVGGDFARKRSQRHQRMTCCYVHEVGRSALAECTQQEPSKKYNWVQVRIRKRRAAATQQQSQPPQQQYLSSPIQGGTYNGGQPSGPPMQYSPSNAPQNLALGRGPGGALYKEQVVPCDRLATYLSSCSPTNSLR